MCYTVDVDVLQHFEMRETGARLAERRLHLPCLQVGGGGVADDAAVVRLAGRLAGRARA